MEKWWDADRHLGDLDQKVLNCKLLADDPKTYEQNFLENNIIPDYNYITKSYDMIPIFESLSEDVETLLKEQCNQHIIERADLIVTMNSLNEQGYGLNYLQQYVEYEDGTDIVYTNLNGDDFDPELNVEESDYLYSIITGPMGVNMVNMGMLFPFLISAIIAGVNIIRRPDDDHASKFALVTMVIGFGFMLIGLTFIIFGFLEIYQPFLLRT